MGTATSAVTMSAMRRPADPSGAGAGTASARGGTSSGLRRRGGAGRVVPSSATRRRRSALVARCSEPRGDDDERRGDEGQTAGPLGGRGHASRGAAHEEPARPPAVLDVAQGEEDAHHRPDGDEDVQRRDARLRDAQRVGGGEEQREDGPGGRETQPPSRAGRRRRAGRCRRSPPGVASRTSGRRTAGCPGRWRTCPSRDAATRPRRLPPTGTARGCRRGRRRWPWRPWRSRSRRTSCPAACSAATGGRPPRSAG